MNLRRKGACDNESKMRKGASPSTSAGTGDACVCVHAHVCTHSLAGLRGCRDDLSFRKRMTPAHRAAAPSRPAQQVSLLSVMKWVSREAAKKGKEHSPSSESQRPSFMIGLVT